MDSGFQNGFLDFTVDFWISQWISGFQFGFLTTVYEISFVTDPSCRTKGHCKGQSVLDTGTCVCASPQVRKLYK